MNFSSDALHPNENEGVLMYLWLRLKREDPSRR